MTFKEHYLSKHEKKPKVIRGLDGLFSLEKINYSVDTEKLEISITDQGDGFKPDAVPDPRCGDNIYRTNGRGLFLICAYMDDVEFKKGGRCVRMIKYKDKNHSKI